MTQLAAGCLVGPEFSENGRFSSGKATAKHLFTGCTGIMTLFTLV